MENDKIIKVASNTNPHSLALSLLYYLEYKDEVTAVAIGEASKKLFKGVAILNSQIKEKVIMYPKVEVIKDKKEMNREAIICIIKKIN